VAYAGSGGQPSPAAASVNTSRRGGQPGEAKPWWTGKPCARSSCSSAPATRLSDHADSERGGLGRCERCVWYLLVVPRATPASIVKQIHDAAKAVVRRSRVREDDDRSRRGRGLPRGRAAARGPVAGVQGEHRDIEADRVDQTMRNSALMLVALFGLAPVPASGSISSKADPLDRASSTGVPTTSRHA